MTGTEILQIVISLIGSVCFGILYNMRGKKLAAGALGGFLSWGLFLALSHQIPNVTLNYFIVAAAATMYSEIMARLLKTPATPVVTISIIPLIPGGSLYYTMAYAFENDYSMFFEKAVSTVKLACALALGIIVATAVSQMLFRHRQIKMTLPGKRQEDREG